VLRPIPPALRQPGSAAPTRVSFEPPSAAKQTFAIRGHVVDLVDDEDDEEAN
jgi:hypothetical protein